jgi:hypothetical protein
LIGDGELLMEEKERTRKIKEEFALKYFNGFIRKISE